LFLEGYVPYNFEYNSQWRSHFATRLSDFAIWRSHCATANYIRDYTVYMNDGFAIDEDLIWGWRALSLTYFDSVRKRIELGTRVTLK
jgi:hypothetical protein